MRFVMNGMAVVTAHYRLRKKPNVVGGLPLLFISDQGRP